MFVTAAEVECNEILIEEIRYVPAQPDHLDFHQAVTPQHEGVPLATQPLIRAWDTNVSVIKFLF